MKSKIIIINILIALLLTGCWNYNEIQNFAQLVGLAIDKGEEGYKYKVTAEIASSKPSADFDIEPILFEINENTIIGALRKMITVSAKKIYVGHCKIIIISEEVSREGISDILDVFLRDHEFRITMVVLVARDAAARDMLDNTATTAKIASLELEKILKSNTLFGSFSLAKQLYHVQSDLLNHGISPSLPVLRLIDFEERKTFELFGVAEFRDDKLVSFIDMKESRYFLNVIDCYKGGVYSVNTDEDNYIAVEVMEEKTKYKFSEENSKIIVTLNISSTVNIIENNTYFKNAQWTEEKIKKLLNEEKTLGIINEVENVKNIVKSDVYGFEKLLKAMNYKLWKKYQNHDVFFLDQIEVRVNSNIKIRGTGIIDLDRGQKP